MSPSGRGALRACIAWASATLLFVLAVVAPHGIAVPAPTAAAEMPCHDVPHAATERGSPCPSVALDVGCCRAVSCTASAWTPSAAPLCPGPAFESVVLADARLHAGGPGITPRPVLPPPRAA